MTKDSSYFAQVQKHLHGLGQVATLTSDECDLVDDYEQQEFSAAVCAGDIARARK